MPEITNNQLEQIRALLAEREHVLRAEVQDVRAAVDDAPIAQGQLVDDLVAKSEERLRRGIELAEIERDQEELAGIQRARDQLVDGTYGNCVDCGEAIPIERLMVQPTALRCISCQAAWETAHGTAAARHGS